MTTPQLPAIPDVDAKSTANVQAVLDSIKELLEILIKRRGTNTDNQAVLYGDSIIDSLNALIDGVSSLILLDTGNDHTLTLQVNENFSANRILNLILGNASRTITLSGSPTLADWFDQAVKQASSPTFAGIVLSEDATIGPVEGPTLTFDGSGNTLTLDLAALTIDVGTTKNTVLNLKGAKTVSKFSVINEAATALTNITSFSLDQLSTVQSRTLFEFQSLWQDNTDATRTAQIKWLVASSGSLTTAMTAIGGNLGIGTTDLDGTPAIGRVTIKGSTNDGSTNVQVWRDSDEANVASLDTNGNLVLLGTVDGRDISADWTAFAAGLTTQLPVGGGAGVQPVWTEATGTGAPVRAGAPTLEDVNESNLLMMRDFS